VLAVSSGIHPLESSDLQGWSGGVKTSCHTRPPSLAATQGSTVPPSVVTHSTHSSGTYSLKLNSEPGDPCQESVLAASSLAPTGLGQTARLVRPLPEVCWLRRTGTYSLTNGGLPLGPSRKCVGCTAVAPTALGQAGASRPLAEEVCWLSAVAPTA